MKYKKIDKYIETEKPRHGKTIILIESNFLIKNNWSKVKIL